MPFGKRKVIEQAKFTYSPVCKAFEKQIKTIEDQGIKQAEVLKASKPVENEEPKSSEGLFCKGMRTTGNKNEVDEIKK